MSVVGKIAGGEEVVPLSFKIIMIKILIELDELCMKNIIDLATSALSDC